MTCVTEWLVEPTGLPDEGSLPHTLRVSLSWSQDDTEDLTIDLDLSKSNHIGRKLPIFGTKDGKVQQTALIGLKVRSLTCLVL